MKVYFVCYDGATRDYSTDIYLQGVYTSREKAIQESRRIGRAYGLDASIHEVIIDSPLEIKREPAFNSLATSVQLGCYFE